MEETYTSQLSNYKFGAFFFFFLNHLYMCCKALETLYGKETQKYKKR